MIKGQLLPKELIVKGKSKYLYLRLKEEGIKFGVDRWVGDIKFIKDANGKWVDSPKGELYRKYNLKK